MTMKYSLWCILKPRIDSKATMNFRDIGLRVICRLVASIDHIVCFNLGSFSIGSRFHSQISFLKCTMEICKMITGCKCVSLTQPGNVR